MASAPGFLAQSAAAVLGVNMDEAAGDPGVFPARAFASSSLPLSGTLTIEDSSADPVGNSSSGFIAYSSSMGFDWFESMHVLPRSFSFGFVLTSQLVTVEIFNAHRRLDVEWLDYLDNGAGIVLVGAPTLPSTVFALGGETFQLEVSPDGDANIDDVLSFLFGTGTISIPVTLTRVVLFPVRPENDFEETLEWLTEVQPSKAGLELRPSLRKCPRQIIPHRFILEDADERASVENLLFNWQARVFGLPVWEEECLITVAAPALSDEIFVSSTAFADFRVGGLVVVYQDRVFFDVAEVLAVNAGSVELASQIQGSYAVGASLIPVRTVHATSIIEGSRGHGLLSELDIRFRVTDNDVSLASLSAFSSLNGKLLLDGYIFSSGESRETFETSLALFDPETGLVYQDPFWDRARRGGEWRFITGTKQERFQHRQMLHAIRGRQISFYLRVWRPAMTPSQPLASGTPDLDIVNVGYTRHIQTRSPKDRIRITFNTGAAALYRRVLSSAEVSATEETLTLDLNWPATFQPEDVERIEFVELVRFDSDTIRIRHHGGAGHTTTFSAPVRALRE